ncbi:unnamed protein product [Pylaiella littoralis]
MLLRHAAVRGASIRAASGAVIASTRGYSCELVQRSPNALPSSRSGRRRPLSSDADPCPPPPTPSSLPQAAQELGFPPPPPPNRGPISPPTDLASSENGCGGGSGGGDTTIAAAAAAPGVTVQVSMADSRSREKSVPVQDPLDPSFEPFGDSLDDESGALRTVDGVGGGGGGGGGGSGGSGGGTTSLDDAWEIDGGAADGGQAAGPLAAAVGTAAPTGNRGDPDGGGGTGSVSPAFLGGGTGAAAQSPVGVKVKVARSGDERAHKIWVTGGGDGGSVTEHEWKAERPSGSAKEDTAVIQFHSRSEINHSRFQGFGVVKKDKAEDIRTLVDSFTAPALAAALRDRETALHACAYLLDKGNLAGVRRALFPFTAQQVANSRRQTKSLDIDSEGFTTMHMYTLRKVLQRLPRYVTTLTEQRASVVIPLCNVDGVASVLFTKRASTMRAHKNEVCFPGGKVDIGQDQHIIQTALREMGEEIGILESSVDVLGVLRCDWAELASLIGVAVTPVVGFLGNLSREQINPNPDEVSHCFTIPIRYLLQQNRWKLEKYKAPAFVGGPYEIWGLTGYILHRLVNDVIRQHLAVM